MRFSMWTILNMTIEPYPFFYVEYKCKDNIKILEYGSNFDNIIVTDNMNGILTVRKTKIFDNNLKQFAVDTLCNLINKLHFSLRFSNKRMFVDYIMDDNIITNEIYNTNIKSKMRKVKQVLKNEINSRLVTGADPFVVKETEIENGL